MVSTAASHARIRGSVPGLGGLKEAKMFLPHPVAKLRIVGSFCDREVACSASDRQVSNVKSCVWRAVPSHSSHRPHVVLLDPFSLYVHKASDRQGSNVKSCVWRAVPSHSSHHPHVVLLDPFSLYVHKGGLKQSRPKTPFISFHFGP